MIKKAQQTGLEPILLRPILEELDQNDIQKILEEDVAEETDEPKLKRMYDELGNPDRIRILDDSGNLYDIIALPNGRVGVEQIEAVLIYKGIKQYDSWFEAQNAIPNTWVKQKAIFSALENEKNLEDVIEKEKK